MFAGLVYKYPDYRTHCSGRFNALVVNFLKARTWKTNQSMFIFDVCSQHGDVRQKHGGGCRESCESSPQNLKSLMIDLHDTARLLVVNLLLQFVGVRKQKTVPE